jgi:hypothetical protein
MPLLRPTVKHSLKAMVVHNTILVLGSVRVVMKNKCFVSNWYSIMYCCFSLDQDDGRPRAKWKARAISIITYMNLNFQLSSQHMCAHVYACMQTRVSMHAGARVITHMHEDSCIDIVHYGRHTNIHIIDNTKICTISGFHIVEVEDSGHLGYYTVWQS